MNEIEVMMAGTDPFFTKVCFGYSLRIPVLQPVNYGDILQGRVVKQA
jgi:hypothetical protein